MTVTVDHSNDYKCWVNVEPVSVEITREGNASSHAVSRAARGPWTRKVDLTAFGASDGQIVAWSIPNKLLNPSGNPESAITIIRDDTIVDESGKRWTVIWSDQAVVDSHWYVATVIERCEG